MTDYENNDITAVEDDTGYDGYYDDILPDDSGITAPTQDKTLIKRLLFVGLGAAAVIGGCAAVMYFFC